MINLDPNLYPPEKINAILKLLIPNIVIESVLLVVIYFLYRHRSNHFKMIVITAVIYELFLFSRGNILTIPLNQLTIPQTSISSTTARYVSTSDIIDFTGPLVYWNHLRVRQPFAPDLTHEELNSWSHLKKEVSMLPGNLNIFTKNYNVAGYSAIVLDSYANYWESTYINLLQVKSVDDPRLDFLGTKYLITGYPQDFGQNSDHWQSESSHPSIYHNTQALDRAFFESTTGSAHITSYLPQKIIIQTSNSQQDNLILTDSYYPGWQAKIDGSNTNILPYQKAFRQIVVPPGDHQITFSYRPNSAKIGLVISFFTSGIIVLIWLWPKIKLQLSS